MPRFPLAATTAAAAAAAAAVLLVAPLGALAGSNGLSQSPVMGWSTWNAYACEIDEDVVLQSAKVLAELKEFGYEYLNIDDCWQAKERNAQGVLEADPEKFPKGLKDVVDQIHGMGLKAGIYSSAGTMTCGRRIASLDHEEVDAQSYADAGFDLLKYDNCYNSGRAGNQKLSYDRYNAMSQALNKTGRPIVYSVCNWGEDQPWLFAPTIANSWRISGDIANSFNRKDERCPCTSMVEGACNTQGFHCSVETIANFAAPLGQKAYPGAWNDLDMLEIGNPVGEGLTLDEAVTHMTLWSMAKSPLIMGNVLQNLTSADRAVLTNEHIIAINQDVGGSPAIRLQSGKQQVWMSSLSNNSYAVALVNFGDKNWDVELPLSDVFFDDRKLAKASWTGYDLWSATDFQNPAKKKGQSKLQGMSVQGKLPHVELKPHQTKVWKIVPKKD